MNISRGEFLKLGFAGGLAGPSPPVRRIRLLQFRRGLDWNGAVEQGEAVHSIPGATAGAPGARARALRREHRLLRDNPESGQGGDTAWPEDGGLRL